MTKKLIFLSLIILTFNNYLFADNIDYKVNKLNKKVYHYKTLIKTLFDYKLSFVKNNIPYNYNPYLYKNIVKINNRNIDNKKLKQQKSKKFIIKIIPKILLDKKVFIKYIKIDNLKNRYTENLWVKPGDKFYNCKFIKIYNSTKLLFKCNKKYIKVEFLPKIKFN